MNEPSPALRIEASRTGDGASRGRPEVGRWMREAACCVALSLADLASVALAAGAAWLEQDLLRHWVRLRPLTILSLADSALLLYASVSIGFLVRGLYLRREPFWEMVRLLAGTVLLSVLVSLAAMYFFQVVAATPRSLVVLWAANLVVAVPAARLLAYLVLHRAGLWRRRAVLLGDPAETGRLARSLEADFVLGYRLVEREAGGPVPEAEEAIVVARGLSSDALAGILEGLHRKVRYLTLVPDLGRFPFGRGDARFLFDDRELLLTSRNLLLDRANLLVKRAFDLAVALALSVPLVPLLAAFAAAIRLDSKGPAIFVQKRIGRGGRSFPCLKFRTMFQDAEESLPEILQDPARRREWEAHLKLAEDPRVTRVGRFLRATSLDELPQLLNVLAGHMSLVGPRPLPDYHYQRLEEPFRSDYLEVLPGLTGLWQVSGRANHEVSHMALLNSWYVRNWSLWLDAILLLRTIRAVVRGEGAR